MFLVAYLIFAKIILEVLQWFTTYIHIANAPF